MARVIAFGAFDPLHEGHCNFLQQAKALGNHLTVVVARGSSIQDRKSRQPHQPEPQRLAAVKALPEVDVALLGKEGSDRYQLLSELDFDIVALGYDQRPSDIDVRAELAKRDKAHVQVVRLQPFQPETYKSTYLREKEKGKGQQYA